MGSQPGRVIVAQGDVWWADFGDPVYSRAGFRRPVVIAQGDRLNQSRVATTICVPLTTNLKWRDAPGNVLLGTADTALDKPSVANVSALTSVGKGRLIERIGRIEARQLERVLAGIDLVLGR